MELITLTAFLLFNLGLFLWYVSALQELNPILSDKVAGLIAVLMSVAETVFIAVLLEVFGLPLGIFSPVKVLLYAYEGLTLLRSLYGYKFLLFD